MYERKERILALAGGAPAVAMAVAAGPASVSAVVAELVLAPGFSVGCKVSESAVVAELASAAGFGVGCNASGTNEY